MASSISLIHVVECPVCILQYDLPDRVPKILGCGHTFCLCCLREMGSGGEIQCPTCRAQYNIPVDGKVEGLISNHGIITLLESICLNCKDHQKTAKCLHCDVTFCASCCQEHLTTWTADIKQSLSNLQTYVDSVTMTPEMTKSMIQSVNDQCHNLREDITRNNVKELQKQQLQLIDKQHEQLCHIDHLQQTKINDILTRSVQQREAVQSWNDRLRKLNMLFDGKELSSDVLANVTREIEQLTGHLKSTDSTVVMTGIDTNDMLFVRGEVASQIDRNEVTDKSTSIPRTHAQITGMVPYISCTLDHYRNLSHPTHILSGRSPDGMKGKYFHMAVSPLDGTIYVVKFGDQQPGQIVHISDSGKHISFFKTQNSPRGISIDTNGNIIVTGYSHTMQYFKPDGVMYDEQGGYGSSTGCFDWIYGVTYGPKNELYVADGGNMRVQVRQPGERWSVHSVYNQKPIGVTLCPDGTLLVCTRSKNPQLWAIDEDGSKTKINITDDGITRDNDLGFSQIAIDKDGYILLADRGSHSILVVDMKGQLHCRIGQKDSLPGQFDNPSGIALTRDGRIVVSNRGNMRIQIF